MGGVNYLLNICRVLRFHSVEVEPVLFVPEGSDAQLEQQFVAAQGRKPVVIPERSRRRDNWAMLGRNDRADMALFADHRIDLVFESAGYYGPETAIPVLSWLPDFQHRRLPHLFSRAQWVAREARFRRILTTRSHILLSSRSALADMRRFYRYSPKNIHVVPFAVMLEHEAPRDAYEKVRRSYGLPERFLFLPNQFWAHKNHQLVIEALGILQADAPVVAVTGNPHDPRTPDLFERLKARVAELGVADKFCMLGQIPYSDLLMLNAGAHRLINPSLFEGWSTTVEEAKALGTPLLLSEIDVHREQAGKDAIFFDPSDAADCARGIVRAMTMNIERDDVGIRALRYAKERSFAGAMAHACFAAVGHLSPSRRQGGSVPEPDAA
jgi:glycosyltransferase involved in cell wall biosynthesis